MGDKKDVGYIWRIGCQTAEGITIDVSGNFGLNATDEEINAKFDQMINIFSRQRAKTVLAEEEKLLANAKRTHAQLVEQLRIAGEKEMTKSSEKQTYANQKQQVDNLEAQIKAREEGIESLKKLI